MQPQACGAPLATQVQPTHVALPAVTASRRARMSAPVPQYPAQNPSQHGRSDAPSAAETPVAPYIIA